MHTFLIQPNLHLKTPVRGYYHDGYTSHRENAEFTTTESVILRLKNDRVRVPLQYLNQARADFIKILTEDIPQLAATLNKPQLAIVCVPRAQRESAYHENQKFFKATLREALKRPELQGLGLCDGTDYILRITDTPTTHLTHTKVAPGITRQTCQLSQEITGKDILLVDDLYTRTVNIDEDALQALLDAGARSVAFYALGYTLARSSV